MMVEQKQIWHNMGIEAVLEQLKSTKNGLTGKEAKEKHYRLGSNKLPEEKPISKIKILFEQFKSPLIYILVIAGIITLVLQDWTDSVVIFAAVFLNAGAIVIRNGQEKEIRQSNLVVGDVVVLRSGDKVPADGRLIENLSLRVNESALTGEWLAAEKKLDKLPEGASLADRKNMIYMGTVIESGRAKAVITGIGIHTEIGKIAQSIQLIEEAKTPYQRKISQFSKIIAIVVGVASTAIFIGGVIAGRDLLEIFVTTVAVAVAAIPEGLPVAITVIMALGMERILKKKGLVRKLVAAEVLGSTSVICTDKTGTLTQAKMQVTNIFADSKDISHELVSKISIFCTEAFVENTEDPTHKWIIRGRPTEKALFLAALQTGMRRDVLEKKEPKIDMLPFDPVYKYSAALHEINKSQDAIYILGAPELILEKSKFLDTNKGKIAITKDRREELKRNFEKMNSQGLRLLAAAYKRTDKNSLNKELKKQEELGELTETQKQNIYEKHLKEMVFVAFIAIKDPLRSDVKGAIATVKEAGMMPVIITGDHPLTAKAIAKELGIPAEAKNVIEGKDFEKLSEKDFKKRLKDITVYARMEPQQKLRIIEAWQNRGEIVAMTGDGVNDAPALKKANIGMALGSGTDVAKEASDLVLLTDSFSIIVTAIKEGRTIVDNVRKVIALLFSNIFGEMILVGASIAAGWPLPILAAQILWINLIEDSLPAIALGFEEPEKGVMKRKPEDPKASLLTKEIKTLAFVIGVVTSFILLGLFIWLFKNNLDIAEIRTIIFAALTIDTIFYVFSCKNLKKNIWEINIFSNRFLLLSWVFAVAMLLAAIYIPLLQTILKTIPLNAFDWALVFAIGFVNLFLIEMIKFFYKKRL